MAICLFFRNFAPDLHITGMSISHTYLRIIAFAVLIAIGAAPSQAQYQTRTFLPSIRTLRVQYPDAQSLQRPYLVLGEDNIIDGTDPTNTLEVSFDEMSHDLHLYTYTVRHLNHDNTPSDLTPAEYLRGFTTADITDYASSLTTQQAYTHYSFTFPNEDMQLTAGGNYALIIYEDGDPEQVVATVCFAVVEPLVSVSAQVRSNTDREFDGRYQQLDIDLSTDALQIKDANTITVVVRQNGRLDNAVTLTHPTYVEPTRLRYSHMRELIFEGGNEFRHFDIYSTYYAGYHVDRIRYAQGEYHAILDTDMPRGIVATEATREGTPYLTEYDTNGQWRINAEKTDDPDVDAEYMWVHFLLPVPHPVMDGNIFVGGELFHQRFTADNLMQYDAETQCYYLHAYLKQGAYDYLYYIVPAQGKPATLLPLEGSHWQTQNDYTIYVYYRPFASRYDRLVAIHEWH